MSNEDKKKFKLKDSAFFKKCRNLLAIVLMVSVLSGSVITTAPKEADAVICSNCFICLILDPIAAVLILNLIQESIGSPLIERSIERHINSEENWIVEDFFEDFWVKGLAEMTHFISAFAMYQLEMVGTLFDAKNYLETKRLFFELHAEANRDYHPSESFCVFGTMTRSLAAAEMQANINMMAMSERFIDRQLQDKNSTPYAGVHSDKHARWEQFIHTYCDPRDNSWEGPGTGLDLACDNDGYGTGAATGATDRNRVNLDIDYTRLIDEPRSLEDVDFIDTVVTDKEEDVMAMSLNLYGHDVPEWDTSHASLSNQTTKKNYLDLRSVVAKRNVAQNSFNAIVSMKSSGFTTSDIEYYMASILKDLMPDGTTDSEIFDLMGGRNPSYYAQLEVLSKKIYQNPDFFANLYDKPANVKRKSVALKAIDMMLDRALYESELRQEMLLSVMLSSKLNDNFGPLNRSLTKGTRQE